MTKREFFHYQPDGRTPYPSWYPRDKARYVAAFFCIALPLIFLSAIFQPVVRNAVMGGSESSSVTVAISLTPDSFVKKSCPIVDNKAPQPSPTVRDLSITTADVAGRYAFSVPSAFLHFVALIGIFFALFVILRRANVMIGALVWLLGLGFGAAIMLRTLTLPRPEGTRAILIAPIVDAAQAAGVIPGATKAYLWAMVDYNEVLSMTATIVMLFGLAVVAIRARDDELTPAVLRQRLFDLRWLMMIAAAILVLAVVTTRSLIDWQFEFLCEPQRNALKPVGNALTNYWGAMSTGILLAALLPAYFAWSRDVARYALLSKPEGTEKERLELIKDQGLDFAPASSVSTLLTIAIPALSGPLLEAIKAVGKFG